MISWIPVWDRFKKNQKKLRLGGRGRRKKIICHWSPVMIGKSQPERLTFKMGNEHKVETRLCKETDFPVPTGHQWLNEINIFLHLVHHDIAGYLYYLDSYYKNLSWVWRVDRKNCPEGYWLVSLCLSSDVSLSSRGTDFSVGPSHPWQILFLAYLSFLSGFLIMRSFRLQTWWHYCDVKWLHYV